ncbi:MAG: hypothetical protein M3R71_03570 [Actinomycetota bacterium]|nr:hypothetical protein [Actinomycetota bacterium]
MTARAELSSASSTLDELVGRITALVEGMPERERDRLSSDLYEVERQLIAAQRRLARLVEVVEVVEA